MILLVLKPNEQSELCSLAIHMKLDENQGLFSDFRSGWRSQQKPPLIACVLQKKRGKKAACRWKVVEGLSREDFTSIPRGFALKRCHQLPGFE